MPGKLSPQSLVDVDSDAAVEAPLFPFEKWVEAQKEQRSKPENDDAEHRKKKKKNTTNRDMKIFGDLSVKPHAEDATISTNDPVNTSVSSLLPEEQTTNKPVHRQSRASRISSPFSSASQASIKSQTAKQQIPTAQPDAFEGFKAKSSALNLIDHGSSSPKSGGEQLQEVSNFDQKTKGKSHSRSIENSDFDDLSLSPPNHAVNVDNDEDWEKIDEELDEATLKPTAIPSVVYQNPTFKAAIQEYVDRYSLSNEQKETLKGVWAIMKWAGELGYAVVSEPVMDAADWIAERQFGCRLEDLPLELRIRIMASLPENVQNALRVTNSIAGRSGEAAASSYRRLSDTTHITMPSLQTSNEGIRERGVEDDEAELIDELEAMNIGSG